MATSTVLSSALRSAIFEFGEPRGYVAAASIGLPPRRAVDALRADLDAWARADRDPQGYDAIADRTTTLPHMLPTPADFAKMVGALGIADRMTIVVYDEPGLFSAPRVRWTFRTMGAHDVRILAGGHTLNKPGYFLAPTIVADIADDSRLVREEQFGPIVPVLKYKEIDEAVARANDTRMGLGASVWTRDLEKGAQVASRLEAGTVWVNHHLGSEADIPFGGFKESGLGREHGILGLQSYMEPQVINVPAA